MTQLSLPIPLPTSIAAAMTLPLAPPERPMIFSDTVVRMTLILDAAPDKPIALELDFEGEDKVASAAKLVEGRMEIALTDGFGRSRSISLSPAEFLLIHAYGDRFFKMLPR